MQPTITSLEPYIAPLRTLSREDQLFIAGYLYGHAEEEAEDPIVPDYAYDTMPGIFSEEEKIQRLIEACNSTERYSLEEVTAQMYAIGCSK